MPSIWEININNISQILTENRDKRESTPELISRCQCNLDNKFGKDTMRNENYRSFLLGDVKLLNRIISNLILQIIKDIIHYDKLCILQEWEVDLPFENQSM